MAGMTAVHRDIFISYARGDGSEYANALRDRLLCEKFSIWQDLANLRGGMGWWNQIEEALNNVNYLLLVMTPGAVESPMTRREWRLARANGVDVIPVIGPPGARPDFTRMPVWMQKTHFYDLDLEWEKLIRHFQAQPQGIRVPQMAPDLQEEYIKRPIEHGELRQLLLEPIRLDPIATTCALQGAGGFGKSTLATAICHDVDIEEAFSDGILWITLGENVTKSDQVEALKILYSALTGERPAFTDVDYAAYNLSQKLESKNYLIVLDDVWDLAHVAPFLRGGKGTCARLITTRKADVASCASFAVKVEGMRSSEAVDLLLNWLAPEDRPEDLTAIVTFADYLGDWPLLLGLAGAALRQCMRRGYTLRGAMDYLGGLLKEKGVVAFDKDNEMARNQAIKSSVEVSLQFLQLEARQRYADLAIFPEDTNIPLPTLVHFWDISPIRTEELVGMLHDASLLKFNPATGTIRLHDTLRSFMQLQLQDPATLHARLLNRWDKRLLAPEQAIPQLPVDDDLYAWRWVGYHLDGTGRRDLLRQMLLNFRWLQAKLNILNINALLADFEFYGEDDVDSLLTYIERALRLSARAIQDDSTQLGSQLASRLMWFADEAEVRSYIETIHKASKKPWLRPIKASLPNSGGMELLSVPIEGQAIYCCGFSSDGYLAAYGTIEGSIYYCPDTTKEQIVHVCNGLPVVLAIALDVKQHSILISSRDYGVQLWNQSSSIVAQLAGPTPGYDSVAVALNGKFYAAGRRDGVVVLWEAADLANKSIIPVPGGAVHCLSFSHDALSLLAGTESGYVARISVTKQAVCHSEKWHDRAVKAVCWSEDDSLIASCGFEGRVQVSEPQTGTVKFCNITGDALLCLAISPDRRLIAAAGNDMVIRVWELGSGEKLLEIAGHDHVIVGLQFLPCCKRIITACMDGSIRVCEVVRPQFGTARYPTKEFALTALAIAGNGSAVATGLRDGRILHWRLSHHQSPSQLHINQSPVFLVALSHSGTQLLACSSDFTFSYWDLVVGKILSFPRAQLCEQCIALSANGEYSLSGCLDGRLVLWCPSNGNLVRELPAHRGAVEAVIFSPNGKFALSGSREGDLYWHDIEMRSSEILRGDLGGISSLAFSSNGLQFVSCHTTGKVVIWDSMGRIERVIEADTAVLSDVALASDGIRSIILRGSYANTCEIVDLERRVSLGQFTGTSRMFGARFDVGGNNLALGERAGHTHWLAVDAV